MFKSCFFLLKLVFKMNEWLFCGANTVFTFELKFAVNPVFLIFLKLSLLFFLCDANTVFTFSLKFAVNAVTCIKLLNRVEYGPESMKANVKWVFRNISFMFKKDCFQLKKIEVFDLFFVFGIWKRNVLVSKFISFLILLDLLRKPAALLFPDVALFPGNNDTKKTK